MSGILDAIRRMFHIGHSHARAPRGQSGNTYNGSRGGYGSL